MNFQIEKQFEEVFKKVSDREVERNPALCRQMERLRRVLFQANNPIAEATVPRKPRRSNFSIAGDYALLK